ncbi:MAG: hypothetical protein ACK5JP_11415 [Akkermansiaceae bacterium]
MTRFEIQDIIRQNQDGVTFRALDKSNDQIVSLRRFFPFGRYDENEEGSEGLDPNEGKAFSTACELLSHIQHPALRKTIYGDIDPIDGMPFLVTEWIEGESLSHVLGSNTMPVDMTIALVQQVFDVCKLLSETLQSEAIWIDTNPQSIIVCNPNENPTFSFRICPFKWLGTSREHLKDMSSIVDLIEALMGWKSKLVSDQAGKGLGGYIKLLRQYPEMEISKASQTLPNHSIEVVEVTTETTTKTPTTLFPPITNTNASFFNKKSIVSMCISALVTGALIFFFYQQRTKETNQNITVESEVYDPTSDPALVSIPEIVTPDREPPTKTPDTGKNNNEKTETTDKTNLAPIDRTDTTPTDKDPKETEETTETDKKVPEESSPDTSSSKTESILNLPTKENPTQKTETTPQNIRSWSPDEISTTAWYDAADASTIIATSGTVSQWRDKSGNDLHLTQSLSARQPSTAGKINNINALDFTGNMMTMSKNPFGASVSNGFVITVYKVDSIQNGTLFSLTGSENHSSRWNAQAPYADKYMYFDCGGVILGSTRLSTSNYGVKPGNTVLASFYSSTTDNLQQVHKNGSLLNGDSSGHAVATVGNISVGGVTNSFQDATIGEFIIINGTVDEATRQKLEGYLAHKWGTTANLPVNHPYKSLAPTPSFLTSNDVEIIKTLDVGDPVTLKGIVKSAKFSSTGKSIYLSFSDPDVESDIRVVIHGNEYDGTAFTEEEFAKLIGKNLVFSGTVYTESFNDRPPFVKITEKAQIKLATKTNDKPNTPEKAKAKLIFTPDDTEAMAKLELKEPATVKGVVKSVKIPKPGGGLYISFSDPINHKQIQVVTYPSPFEDGPHDDISFKKIEAEFQHLVGKTVTFNGSVSRQKDNSFQFVYISKREHIVVEEKTDKSTSNAQNLKRKARRSRIDK